MKIQVKNGCCEIKSCLPCLIFFVSHCYALIWSYVKLGSFLKEVLGILWFQVCYDKIFLFCWKQFKKHDHVLKLYISHLKIKLFDINCIIFKLIYLFRGTHTRIKHCVLFILLFELFFIITLPQQEHFE